MRPLVYITAAWKGQEAENIGRAAKYCREVYDAGYHPYCPLLMQTAYLKGTVQERKDAVDMAHDMLRRSRILVVCGDDTDSYVLEDIAYAKHLHIASTTLNGMLAVDKKQT